MEDVQFPSFTDDPGGFIRAEARRITQNVAKGRTFMDEYLDTPATRDFYAATTGDEDDAYYRCTVGGGLSRSMRRT